MHFCTLLHLDRVAYIQSIADFSDPKTIGFAKFYLQWWDRHFSWKKHGCIVLSDSHGVYLCYIFYKIDRYGDYLTIHNLFTPKLLRHNGYARQTLSKVCGHSNTMNEKNFEIYEKDLNKMGVHYLEKSLL